MSSNFKKDDPSFGKIDLDDEYVTESWLVDQFVGNNIWNWGHNTNGQLGQNNITHRSSPVQVGALTSWKQVSCGIYYTMAVKNDGTLWAWGAGFTGELGLNTGVNTHYSSPVQVGSGTTWKLVACGTYSTFAIKYDGTLWAWGDGINGALGLGSVTNRSSPIQIGSGTDWKLIATGLYNSAAIKNNGTLWTWGQGSNGGLALEDVAHRSSPVQVGSLTNWKQAGYGANLLGVINTNNELWVAGMNNNALGQGALGLGDITNRSSLVQVGLMTNWKQVSCGRAHITAIKTDGTLWTWGANGFGQLGLGNITHRSSPVQVGSGTNWKQVWANGIGNTFAIKTDGTLWAWGHNASFGMLGLGDLTHRSSPVQVGSGTNWKQVTAGYYTSSAVTYTEVD